MSVNRPRLQSGLLAGAVNVALLLLGVTSLAGAVVADWFGFRSQSPGAWILLLSVAAWGGARASSRYRCTSWTGALVAGLWAGVPTSLLVTVPVGVFVGLTRSGIDARKWLAQMSPEAMETLSWGLSTAAVIAMVFCALLAGALTGAVLAFASARYGWRQKWQERREAARSRLVAGPLVQNAVQYEHSRRIAQGVGVLVLLLAPFVLGRYWNYTLGTVGIYVILGLGLNVVVGMAGLLNLGYAAFFAIGSYTVAILTSSQYGLEWSFWVALPIGVALAGVTGVLLSLPVLRMRGDYLAIVTLGFGEIIRILLRSDALTDLTGGPRGIRAVGGARQCDRRHRAPIIALW